VFYPAIAANLAAFGAPDFSSRSIRLESKAFARSNSTLRVALRPRPARLMKYVSMRIPEAGPLGETRFDARVRAMVAAFFVNRPVGGRVESVLTCDTQRFFLDFLIPAS
jgi:hypothetical protein